MRRLLAALAVAVGISLLGVPAAQASHPHAQITVSPRNTYAGQLVLVSGSCLRTGAVARIEIDRHLFALTLTGSAGHFSFVKRPPTTTGRGHTIRLQGSGCLPRTIVYFRIDVHRLIGQTVARRNWFFRGTAQIPSDISLGTHPVSAQCRVGGRVVGTRNVNVVEYPGLEASLGGMRVERSTVVAGRTIAFSAQSCKGGLADASLDNHSIQLAAPDRRGGIFRAKATIPSGTPAGVHQLLTRCDGAVAGAATVQVVATNAVASGATSSLPERRSNIVPGVSLGLALIVIGALVLTGISRRRRGAVRP